LLLLRCLVVLSLAGTCAAQLPDSVTWVVGNIDKVRPAWEALGLSDIHEYPNIQLAGQFRGKPVTIYAWQITGRLGNLTIDMIQPAEGQANAYTSFLSRHGDGILSMAHTAASREATEQEILRMQEKGVGVMQQVTMQGGRVPVTYTYFDTEPQGKFALGLRYEPGGAPSAASPLLVSHLGLMARDPASVSAYWDKLGFPALEVAYGDRREGIHHLGMPVQDLAKAIAAYEKLGYHVRQSESGQYIDTDSAGGICIQLVALAVVRAAATLPWTPR
jgi:glyoxalase/bleomycin resistance protein/dioxygenase superfamily protein